MKQGISLYCLQEDYYLGKLSLEDCIRAAVKDIGVDGIEYLPEQMPLPGFPNLTEEDAKLWKSWMEKYQATPVSYTTFLDYTLYRNRTLTVDECVKLTIEDIKRAALLGFPLIRTLVLIKQDIEMFEKCLPAAEHYGVKLCLEIHAPRSIKSWYTQDFLEMILKTGTKYAGFIPDFGIFTKGVHEPMRKAALRSGTDPEIVAYIVDRVRQGVRVDAIDVEKMGGGEKELRFCAAAQNPIYDKPEWLDEIMPYIYYVHGKFYEIGEDGTDPSIDTEGAVKALKAGGYNGYIGSEYEGQRHYFDVGCDISVDAIDQCRRHQQMIGRYING
ncbi:sugar phosphate isomerase/epimerase [Oscillospiraceae bacterium OttesenSCG-928-F05]|nr:sugar phosphate isomerase/epimerase [Oscillospiraceae bacterium OttesenSCG-928-F05]